MNENTEKWKKTGLLDTLDEVDSSLLADNLEECVDEIIKHHNNVYEENIASCLLPIMVRLFSERNIRFLNIEKLCKNFSDFYNKNQKLISDLDSYIAHDGESEFCSLYVDQFDLNNY